MKRSRHYTIDHNGKPVPYLIGWDGERITRTPSSHPYAYDAHFTWKSERFETTDHAVYSDRLFQWNSNKFDASVTAVWPENPGGQMFYSRNPVDIQRFLCLYFGKDVELTGVLQGCNVSNGYPYWIFAYRDIPDTK